MDTSLAAAIHKENVHIIGGGKATVTMNPDKLKTVKTAGKKRKASADLIRSTHKPVAEASKDVDLKQNSAIKGNKIKKNQMTQGKRHAAVADRTTKKHHILIDEEIKKCCEWPKHILIEIKQHHEWLTETKQRREWDARALFMMTLELFLRESISNLKPPSLSDEEGYKTDGSAIDCFKVVPGSYYTPEELDDPLDKAGMVLEEYAFPELKLYDD